MSIFLKITLVLVTIPFFLLSYFNHPVADDFCYANKILNLGFWKAQIDWYLEWSGRYFGTAANSLYSTFILAVGKDNFIANYFEFYKFVTPFLLGLFFFSLFCFFKAIASKIAFKGQVFWITLLGFTIYLSTMPSTAEGFYWMNGAFYYTIGSSLLLLFFSLLLSYEHFFESKNFSQKALYVLVCSLLVIAIAGSAEVLALPLLVIVFLGVLITSYIRHNTALFYRIMLGVAVLFVSASFLSPGTFRRQDVILEAEKVDLTLRSVAGFIVYFIRNLNTWAINPVLLSVSILVIPIVVLLAKKTSFYKYFKSSKMPIIIYLVFWLSLVTITFFLPLISAGYLPGRVLNISYFIFLLGWFLGMFILVNFLGNQFLDTLTVPKYVNIAAQTILIISLIFDSNFGQASYDLFVSAPRYNNQLQNRYDLIQTNIAQNQKNLLVPTLKKPVPKTIYFSNDITNQSKYWSNKCYAAFFQLDSIATTNKRK